MSQAFGAAGFAGLGMGIFKAVSTAATFEEAMIRVRANARLLGKEGEASFRKLEKAIRNLGATTRFTSVEAAEAGNQLVLGGLSPGEASRALPAVLNLAASAGFDLGDAAKVVVDNMVKFRMAAADTGKIADFLSSAQSRAQTTAQELAIAHTALGSTAADLGISFRDTNALFIGLAKSGVRGGEAGTAMAIALQRLIAQPKEAAEALKLLNINIRDFATGPGGALDAIGLFRALADAMPTDAVMRSEKAFALFGARGRRIVGLLSLMQRGKFVENTAKGLDEDLGRAARVAAARMDTFIGTLKELISALSELAIATLTPVLKAMEPLVDVIKFAALGIAKFSSMVQKWDKAMGGMIGRTIKATIAVIALRKAITLLGPAARAAAWAIKLATISTGWFAIVAVVGMAVAGIITFIDWLKKTAPVQAALSASADTFRAAWERVKQAFDLVVKIFVSGLVKILNWTGLANIDIRSIGDSVAEMAAVAVKWIADFVLNASEWVVAFLQNWNSVMGVLPVALKAALSFAGDVFTNWIRFGIESVEHFIKTIIEAFSSIPDLLRRIFEEGLGPGEVAQIIEDGIKAAHKNRPDLDLFAPSKRTQKYMEDVAGVFDDIAKSKAALEAGREELFKPEEAMAKAAAAEAVGMPEPKAGFKEEIGFKGLAERGRGIQESFLEKLGGKKDDVQEEQLGVAEASRKIQMDMLETLQKKNGDGLVAGNG